MAADIGLIGLALMGQNLVLNMEKNGATVAVHNRTASVTRDFIQNRCQGKRIVPAYQSVEELIALVEKPRRVMIMVRAGDPVDAVIGQLRPHLETGDLVIDGGNSNFRDTIRRDKELSEAGIRFIGTGISGGEEGALYGPSIMPGGTPEGYQLIEELFTAIAAQAEGEPCCTYIGKGGAGHFVKMVHNGIEYGDMQLIAECYHLLRRMGLDEGAIADVFERWNRGRLESYLVQITADILRQQDPGDGGPFIRQVLDRASHKGTGVWTVQESLELGVPAPTIYSAVAARVISSRIEERRQLADGGHPEPGDRDLNAEEVIDRLEEAMHAAKIASYAQGMRLIQESAGAYDFGSMNLARIAEIWRAGCIIRARFLNDIAGAYREDPRLLNLVGSQVFREPVNRGTDSLAEVTSIARAWRVPTPAMDASFAYLISIASAELPGASMVQAQRDYFGGHTYERRDRPGVFHIRWMDTPRREENVSGG